MSKKLSSSLSQFLSSNTQNQFENPFNDEIPESSQQLSRALSNSEMESEDSYAKECVKKKKKKDKNRDKFSDVLQKGNNLVSDMLNEDDYIDDFEGYLDGYFEDDEDTELRMNLIRHGRKYARENKVSGETSEIHKAYSENEKLLSDLLKEIEADKELVQKDISNMRMMRTRNYKTLSDLIESKANFHNTALSVIKEMNSMKKNQFELQMKVDRTKKEEANDDSTANRAIQQLFSIGRSSILSSGGDGTYADISGAMEAGVEDTRYYEDDEAIQRKLFDEYEESDGDKFLKYEGMGVHYVLLYNDDGYREIIAEDKDGNEIPDYPLPSDPDNLDFSISESTNTATDNLSNQYILRKLS